jgi:glycosyltransferase involved in cell wall biosynthesis
MSKIYQIVNGSVKKINKKDYVTNIKDLVSIAMTCYNQENFICEALQSVFNQSYTNWEILIVNDCSTDHSLKTIKKFCKNKVRILNHTINEGYGSSLNDALKYSSGEFIGILDADDSLYDKDAIKISVEKHKENPDVAMTYSNYNECDRKMGIIQVFKTRQIGDDDSYLHPKKKVRMSHFKMLKKKYFDMTEGINPDLKQTVDKDLVLKLEEVGKMLFIEKVLYNYRKHNNNLTRSIRRKEKSYRKFVQKMRVKIFEDARRRRGEK